MNAAIIPTTSALAIVSSPAPTPPPTTTLRGGAFADVYADVQQRADDMLPDRIVHVADLRMNPEGLIELPGGAQSRINSHAKRQVSSLLGLRWDRSFQRLGRRARRGGQPPLRPDPGAARRSARGRTTTARPMASPAPSSRRPSRPSTTCASSSGCTR